MSAYMVVEVVNMQEFILECFVDLMAEAEIFGIADQVLELVFG